MALTLRPSTYESLVRPLLFRLPPERAQRLADLALGLWPLWRALSSVSQFESPALHTTVAGLDLDNPVGLAAGYDKNCVLVPSLSSLGFGYVTCGTVTQNPRPGNPGIRLIRSVPRGALINSLGFPGMGLESAAESIEIGRPRSSNVPLVVSVSGTDIDQIVTCHRRLEPLTDAVEVNVSSPNTAGLRVFHDPDVLTELLTAIGEQQSKPLFLKFPPFPPEDEDPDQYGRARELAESCVSCGVDALTVANTQPVTDPRLGVGTGGLSGRPILGQTLRMVSEVCGWVGDVVAINACGGIFSSWDAWQALAAGADTVQLLTGFVYRGPGVARDICKGLAELAAIHGVESVRRPRLARQR